MWFQVRDVGEAGKPAVQWMNKIQNAKKVEVQISNKYKNTKYKHWRGWKTWSAWRDHLSPDLRRVSPLKRPAQSSWCNSNLCKICVDIEIETKCEPQVRRVNRRRSLQDSTSSFVKGLATSEILNSSRNYRGPVDCQKGHPLLPSSILDQFNWSQNQKHGETI